MIHRLFALLGSIAYGLREFAGLLLGMVRLRAVAPLVVPALIALLAFGAIRTALDTIAIYGDEPEVTDTTLDEVVAYQGEGGSIWFRFDALIEDSHLPTDIGQGTFFYVARHPDEPSEGLLVRSRRNDAFFRQRVVGVEVVEDPERVAEASEALGPIPGGFALDPSRYLEELEAGGEPAEAFQLQEIGGEPDGSRVLAFGRVVSPERHAACAVDDCDGPDAAWWYLFAEAEGGSAILLRSPHPPDAVPVRLEGLYLRDTFDLRPVVESDWLAEVDAEVPTTRSFFAGSRPPITVEPSWVPTIVFAAGAVLLLASLVVGYPVFRRSGPPSPRRSMEPGERIELDITGTVERPDGALTLRHSPGALTRLRIPELALQMWRYGMLPRELSRREAEERFIAEAAGERDRLIIDERDQSALVVLGRDGQARVDAGRLYRVAGSRPALHVRQAGTDAYLAAASEEERDRAAAEIAAESAGRA